MVAAAEEVVVVMQRLLLMFLVPLEHLPKPFAAVVQLDSIGNMQHNFGTLHTLHMDPHHHRNMRHIGPCNLAILEPMCQPYQELH